jgi:hypothetical protein
VAPELEDAELDVLVPLELVELAVDELEADVLDELDAEELDAELLAEEELDAEVLELEELEVELDADVLLEAVVLEVVVLELDELDVLVPPAPLELDVLDAVGPPLVDVEVAAPPVPAEDDVEAALLEPPWLVVPAPDPPHPAIEEARNKQRIARLYMTAPSWRHRVGLLARKSAASGSKDASGEDPSRPCLRDRVDSAVRPRTARRRLRPARRVRRVKRFARRGLGCARAQRFVPAHKVPRG